MIRTVLIVIGGLFASGCQLELDPLDVMPDAGPLDAPIEPVEPRPLLVDDLRVGAQVTCATTQDGRRDCWGRGQAADLPTDADFITIQDGCGLKEDGTIECWRQPNHRLRGGSHLAYAHHGGNACAVSDWGELRCLGSFVNIPAGYGFTAVGVSELGACASHPDFTQCWNDSGTIPAPLAGNTWNGTCGKPDDSYPASYNPCLGLLDNKWNALRTIEPTIQSHGQLLDVSYNSVTDNVCLLTTANELRCSFDHPLPAGDYQQVLLRPTLHGEVLCARRASGTIACHNTTTDAAVSVPSGTFAAMTIETSTAPPSVCGLASGTIECTHPVAKLRGADLQALHPFRSESACATTTGGTRCWGGDFSMTLPTTFQHLVAGEDRVCGLTHQGIVECYSDGGTPVAVDITNNHDLDSITMYGYRYGGRIYGKRGATFEVEYGTPQWLQNLPAPSSDIVAFGTPNFYTLARLSTDGQLEVFRYGTDVGLFSPPGLYRDLGVQKDPSDSSSPPPTEYMVCGVSDDNVARCWDWNENEVWTAEDIQKLSVGSMPCGVQADGKLVCATQLANLDVSKDSHDHLVALDPATRWRDYRIDNHNVLWLLDQDQRLAGFPDEQRYLTVGTGGGGECRLASEGRALCSEEQHGFSKHRVPDESGFVSLHESSYGACAMRSDGSLACWGGLESTLPTPPGLFRKLASAGPHFCGVRTDGSATCWKHPMVFGDELSPPIGEFVDISIDATRICGLRTDSTLSCWATNQSTITQPPQRWADGSPIHYSAVALPCALTSEGRIVCMGTPAPRRSDFVSLQVGGSSYGGGQTVCGQVRTGEVVCWGEISFGFDRQKEGASAIE